MKTGAELLAEAMSMVLDKERLKTFYENLTPQEQEAMRETWHEIMAEITSAWEPLKKGMHAAAQSICEWAAATVRTLEEAGYVFGQAGIEAEDGREKEESGE